MIFADERISISRPAKTDLIQLCADTRYSLENLPGAINGERESGNFLVSS